MSSITSVLEHAKTLVHGSRGEDYGHPLDDFSRTAKIWSAILGIEVSPEQVGLCMVGVKLSRQVNRPNVDNLVDGAGYFETVHMVLEERKRRSEEWADFRARLEEAEVCVHGGVHLCTGSTPSGGEDIEVIQPAAV